MDAVLAALGAPLKAAWAALEARLKPVLAVCNHPIAMDDYLVYSTVLSVFLMQLLIHKGVDIFLGYPIVVLNTALLFGQDRLLIHRHHALAVSTVAVISLIASGSSSTPGFSIMAQVVGILLFSVYFFSMLTNFGLSVPRWMELYVKCALVIVIIGFAAYVGRRLHLLPVANNELRLRSIYAEPSLFIYVTLPAFGIYANAFLRTRKYKLELFLFFLAYVLADSSLGFLGMLLIAFFALLPRLSIWKMFGFGFLAFGAFTGLFFASSNFRLRVVDTAIGIVRMSFSHVNASTFAVLSNAYVTIQTFLSHPLIGVGIGGYQYAYLKYMPIIGADLESPDLLTLNMFDASSLFLRTAAELGLFGLVGLIGFLIVCSRVRGDQHVDIRNALMPYLLIRMGRYGGWFSLELYFFVGLFLLNYLHSRARYGTRRAPAPPDTNAAI